MSWRPSNQIDAIDIFSRSAHACGPPCLCGEIRHENRRKRFCSRCGSQLFIRRQNRPEIAAIPLGTLDDAPSAT